MVYILFFSAKSGFSPHCYPSLMKESCIIQTGAESISLHSIKPNPAGACSTPDF